MGGRRKRGDAIQAELAEREAERDRYRPLPTKAKSTPLEKQRLQNINMFKGGKGLPEELTLAPIQGTLVPVVLHDAPHNESGHRWGGGLRQRVFSRMSHGLLWRLLCALRLFPLFVSLSAGNIPLNMMIDPAKARARMKLQAQRKAVAAASRAPAAAPVDPKKAAAQELFDEIVAEIDERVEFLRRMQELGQAKKHEATIKGEIADRTKQLEKLNAILSAPST